MHGTTALVHRCASAVGRMAVLCVVLAGAGFGCASAPRSPFLGQDETTIRIEIDNRIFGDATVHAIWPGQRRRLGTVTGATTATFRIEWVRSVLLRFEIDLLAGPECGTPEIWADPGDIIVLNIDTRFMNGPYCRE